MNDSTIDWAHIINQALSVEQLDTTKYNQVNRNRNEGIFPWPPDVQNRSDRIGTCGLLSDGFGRYADWYECIRNKVSWISIWRIRNWRKWWWVQKSNGTLYPITQIPSGTDKLQNFCMVRLYTSAEQRRYIQLEKQESGRPVEEERTWTGGRIAKPAFIWNQKGVALWECLRWWKPRAYHHEYIYVGRTKRKITEDRGKHKAWPGYAPLRNFSPEDIRGKFIEGTTYLKRRKEADVSLWVMLPYFGNSCTCIYFALFGDWRIYFLNFSCYERCNPFVARFRSQPDCGGGSDTAPGF